MTEVGIVGPPGPVALTLSGGLNSEGMPIQSATLTAHLTAGEMATDKLGVTHWPPGKPLAYSLHACIAIPFAWDFDPMHVAFTSLSGSVSIMNIHKHACFVAAYKATQVRLTTVQIRLTDIRMQVALSLSAA